jgi:glycosyltransferase involved in cell wall biosynthesis
MLNGKKIAVIIPALNEEKTIGRVLGDIDRALVDEIVVVDNGSSDATADIARNEGATVLKEERRGYGYPCLRAMEYLKESKPFVVAFVDANYSDHPDELVEIVRPVAEEGYDLVCGSRILGNAEPGSLRFTVRFGNALATFLMRLLYGVRYTDVGPFRAIRFDQLMRLRMQDNLGWTVEMQAKAAKCGLRIKEVPVSYRCGTGKSKFTGNIKGVAVVGYRIIRAVFGNLFFSIEKR